MSQIHELLQSNCNIISFHLKKNYKFDSDKRYKYYNPNLIRNNGLIKKDHFQTSIMPCSCVTKKIRLSHHPIKSLIRQSKTQEKYTKFTKEIISNTN